MTQEYWEGQQQFARQGGLEMLLSPAVLDHATTTVLAHAGLSPDQAQTVASVLVYADKRGMWSHGVYRLDSYVKRILAGGVNVAPNIEITSRGSAALLVDGDSGMGPVVSMKAMDATIELAKETGIALALVGKSGHFGMASAYSDRAAASGQIGMVWTTTSAVMAPWGGRGRLLGNNPIAVSIPTQSGSPITLDMALSVVAGGKIRIFADRGDRIPSGWALDEAGRETTDPSAARRGSLMPVGGYKGYGLSFITEAILVGLTSGIFGFEAPDLWDAPGTRQSISHLFITVDVGHYCSPLAFSEAVSRLIKAIKDTQPIPPADNILLPGELEQIRALQSEKAGIQLPLGSERSLRAAADSVKLSMDAILG